MFTAMLSCICLLFVSQTDYVWYKLGGNNSTEKECDVLKQCYYYPVCNRVICVQIGRKDSVVCHLLFAFNFAHFTCEIKRRI